MPIATRRRAGDRRRAVQGHVAALQVELDKKTAEAAEKHDAFVRAVAETENVRRRLEKEKEETAKYAISKFTKDILSVGDNFQRAISAVPAEAAAADPALKNFLDGVILAERDFRSRSRKMACASSIRPASRSIRIIIRRSWKKKTRASPTAPCSRFSRPAI